MRNQTAAEIINLIQKQFARWGIPEDNVTDSGTNYDSVEFSQLCKQNNIEQTKYSPHHQQSNEKSESAVKIIKTSLKKTEKTALNPYEALLDRHNTPTIGMTTSSAQRFLNRRTRTEIPTRGTLLTPEIAEEVLEEETRETKKPQVYYNKSVRDLNELKPGDTVRVKPETLVKGQEWKKGTVTQSHEYRSYDVNVGGKVLRRNRVHRKPDKQVKITEPSRKSQEQRPKDEFSTSYPPEHAREATKQTAKTWKLNAPI